MGFFAGPKRRTSRRRRRNPGSADGTAARELELFIVNDGDLYRRQTQPIIQNLAKKMKKGVYDATKAMKLWGYLADAGAQKYTKEMGDSYGKHGGNGSYGAFNEPTRMAAAKSLADYYLDDVKEAAGTKSNPHRHRRHHMAKRRKSRRKAHRSTKRGIRVTFRKGGRHTVVFKRKKASAATRAMRRRQGKRLAKMWTRAERMANLRKAWAANRRRGRSHRRVYR